MITRFKSWVYTMSPIEGTVILELIIVYASAAALLMYVSYQMLKHLFIRGPLEFL